MADPEDVANTISGTVEMAVQAGTIHEVHLYQQPETSGPWPASRSTVELPYRAGIVPPRALAFQRRSQTARPGMFVMPRDSATVTDETVTTTVLSGMGGVGKTQIAIDFAERTWAAGETDLLVWVSAGSREAIVSSYARLAVVLLGIEDQDRDRGARRLLEWLANASARWLVVLDDLQRPSDLNGLWPPEAPWGRVVVTTRRRDAALRGHRRQFVEIEVFTDTETFGYLTGVLVDRAHLMEGASALASELGHLPLALAQAAAYMLDRELSCSEYLARWVDRRNLLTSLLPDDEALPDDYQVTLAATWSLSVEQADRLAPAGVAGVLLTVASMLDSNGIPVELFSAPSVLQLLATHLQREVSAQDAQDGLGCLQRLSLITSDRVSNPRGIRVHALVQRATRDNLPEHRKAAAAHAAVAAVLHIWPTIDRDTTLAQVLRANASSLNEICGEYLWESGAHELLLRAGESLVETGLVSDATRYFQELATRAFVRLGPLHADTLAIRGHLPRCLGRAGDPTAAATACESLLLDQLEALGPHHPRTLATRIDLAYWRGKTGDVTGALAAGEELLADQLQALGPHDPDVLMTRHYIAYWRGKSGDVHGALTACQELLIDRLRVLGPDHPDTMITRGNIARWRAHSGDIDGGIEGFEAVLADQLRVLGPDHPGTLIIRGSIARWRGEAGDPVTALAAFEELLIDHLRVLGPHHPNMFIIRGNIARWRGEAGDPAAAVSAFEELLADCLEMLGPDHPDTARTIANVAYWKAMS
ncbi:FxSxx-COOH system tetratricopeptide repeat protein [Kutzneria sp. 744]|uniref:FxSxx-COOH system tetratricopeptide repeat protein n=1 Tax=Kutzneria sp. (strain 744) TaxID=345341 RepID=UPI0003EEAAFC|nr:FxSxx-COOH system tetratricopeptide repeat protein [Kutzneria sp. 744]EWM15242.1 ATP/GTP binding protein [Kutzneria sp. 744]